MVRKVRKKQKSAKLQGEVIVVPSKKAVEPDFFRALMAFQYGEGEESNAGFEQMKKLAQSPPEERRGKVVTNSKHR